MNFIRRLQLLWEIVKHRKTPWVVRLLLVGGFVYILLPFDLIPDHFLIVGWLDDLALAVVLVAAALKWTPETLLADIIKKTKEKND